MGFSSPMLSSTTSLGEALLQQATALSVFHFTLLGSCMKTAALADVCMSSTAHQACIVQPLLEGVL